MSRISLLIAALCIAYLAYAQPMPQVIWDRSGLYGYSHFGSFISSLGDQNDDGFNDWMVCAPGVWDDHPEQSYIELFHGGSPPSNVPYRRYTTGDTLYNVGFGSTCGDLNNDGYEDYQVILWPVFNQGLTTYIYFGGSNQDTLPDLVRFGGYYDYFEKIGDFNGDGFDDLFLVTDSGYGQVMLGGNPMDLVADLTIHDFLPYGYGDINADGYADVAVGAGNDIRIYWGSANPDTLPGLVIGIAGTENIRVVRSLNADGAADFVSTHWPDINVRLGGQQVNPEADYILAFPSCTLNPTYITTAGDFNDDGYNDLVAISRFCDQAYWGRFALYLGHPWLNPQPVLQFVGRGWQNLIGITTACSLGDVNGDGIDDIAVGATNEDTDGTRGRVIIIAGDSSFHVDAEDQRPELPMELQVMVFPNPFNSETSIQLNLPPYTTEVQLTVYNLLGQIAHQSTIREASQKSIVPFNGKDFSSGLYLLRVSAGTQSVTQKLMLLK